MLCQCWQGIVLSIVLMPFCSLLRPYPVRKRLLQNLSAYEIAKLDVTFRRILGHSERAFYLNPLRDLFEDIAEVQALETYGMKLLLLGNDVLALLQRLQRPRHHMRQHAHCRKLQLYLIGLCPVLSDTTEARDRLLNFSLFGARTADSMSEDTIQMRLLRAEAVYENLSPKTMFIMSFGGRNQPNKHRGSWLHVQTVPDSDVDLRVYVPSFLDRQRREVHFPYSEARHISKCVTRKAWLLPCLSDILRMVLGIHVLCVAFLTSRGIQLVGPHGRLWSQKHMSIQGVVLDESFNQT